MICLKNSFFESETTVWLICAVHNDGSVIMYCSMNRGLVLTLTLTLLQEGRVDRTLGADEQGRRGLGVPAPNHPTPLLHSPAPAALQAGARTLLAHHSCTVTDILLEYCNTVHSEPSYIASEVLHAGARTLLAYNSFTYSLSSVL